VRVIVDPPGVQGAQPADFVIRSEIVMEFDYVLGAALIFFVRVLSITIATLRYLFMGRASKLVVFILAAFEALTFALTFGVVAQDLTNIPFLVSYSLGFATGTYVGLFIEEKLGQGYSTVNIISMTRSLPIVEAVRKAGFGATRTAGEGVSGSVGLIYVVARRKDVGQVVKIANDIDPKAFITVEEARSVSRGFLGYGRS